jgi:glutamine amidotransferase
MKQTVIVDYGLGNLRSVLRGLEKAGARVEISNDPEAIVSADGIILPGVGAFHEGMEQLGGLKSALQEASGKVPVLGICLGMQMLMDWSEEHGLHQGCSLIPGMVRSFPRVPGFKVPHMGWNSITLEQPGDPLFTGLSSGTYLYFVHSFYADTVPVHSLATTEYICRFSSVISRGTVYGVQFHPEKSGAAGLRLLENFIGLM